MGIDKDLLSRIADWHAERAFQYYFGKSYDAHGRPFEVVDMDYYCRHILIADSLRNLASKV